MAILSMKEFASSMNMPYDTVKKNCQRGNLIKGTGGKIDTENPKNKLFIDKLTVSNVSSLPKEDIKTTTKGTSKTVKRIVERPTELTKLQKELADLEKRKKLADVDLVERGAELKRIQLEKAAGNLLPVDLVSKIFTINIQSIFKTLDGSLENMATIYVERFGGTAKDLADITKAMRLELSKSIDKSKELAFLELDNAVNEFSETKGRGER